MAAFVAYVHAGGPAAYSIAALSGDHAYVGSQQEHTVKVCQRLCSSYLFRMKFARVLFFCCLILSIFFTSKGLYGQNVVSQYSKAVDSAHSSVRVSSSRQSNDVLGKQIIPQITRSHFQFFVPPIFLVLFRSRAYIVRLLCNLFAHKLLSQLRLRYTLSLSY